MKPLSFAALALTCAAILTHGTSAQDSPADQRKELDKGLAELAKTQARDGHWEGKDGKRVATSTAQAGLAFLMDGHTLHQGNYKVNVTKAVDWLLDHSGKTGFIGDARADAQNYMDGHGHAMLFLACVYAGEEKGAYRKEIGEVLKRAVEFSGKAQTSRGGWHYVTAEEGKDFDVGESTVAQVQGLQACHLAGIEGPRPILDRALKYLENCTTDRGGVIFSLAQARGFASGGGERPPLTAAALVCYLCAGKHDADLVKKWLKYCQTSIPVGRGGLGNDEFTHFNYAQALCLLGNTGYARLFPGSRPEERLAWSKYKQFGRPIQSLAQQLIVLQLDSTPRRCRSSSGPPPRRATSWH